MLGLKEWATKPGKEFLKNNCMSNSMFDLYTSFLNLYILGYKKIPEQKGVWEVEKL